MIIATKIKSWEEATAPFKKAVEKSNFSEEDLKKLIIKSRKKIHKSLSHL